MGYNFCRKAHKTTTSSSLTYLTVVYRDSVRIALTISSLHAIFIIHTLLQNVRRRYLLCQGQSLFMKK